MASSDTPTTGYVPRSTQLDQSTPAPPPQSRWTPQAVIGLLCLVGAVVLRRLIPEHGPEIADSLSLLGGSLVGWAPPLPPLKPPGSPGSGSGTGGAGTGVGIGLMLALLAMLAPGCGPRLVTAERSVTTEIHRGPPCLIVVRADGELVARVDWVHRCEVTLPETPAPAVTP